MQLSGKVAVVTGAASGMGRAMAETFAAAGAKVVLADWNEAGGQEAVRAITNEGREAVFFQVDVSQVTQVRELVAFAVGRYGRLDVMVNNAGVALLGQDGPVAEVSEETWEKVININLKGVYLGMKYALPQMVAQGGGVIINTASIAGLVGFPGLAAYCASKGGIIQLTRATALDYAAHNVRVNAICPGVIRTAMTTNLLADPEVSRRLQEATPLRRFGEPVDVAQAALYLASDASAFVTGTVLVIDGGWTAQ
ncbi:MAG: SDR family oxidoreductase [Clostridia bacterium]|nr:SDR family oxidoreductase [Clostridia bacterium]